MSVLKFNILYQRCKLKSCVVVVTRLASTQSKNQPTIGGKIEILGNTYPTDAFTNISHNLLSKVGKNIHNEKYHPLNLIKERITEFFYSYRNRWGRPAFSMYDQLSPIVSIKQNFDSILVPPGHVSRALTDSYYINNEYMLRTHTSAHQQDLIRSGLDAFLVFGDVYRRDDIDSTHYPVFHQVEGLRTYDRHELFSNINDSESLQLFEDGDKTTQKQFPHTMETAKLLEHDLKKALEDMSYHLFGKDIEMQWVDAYFPFTHPSWELEIKFEDKWMEVLGCGIVEQQIVNEAGARDRVGWAFGLGLERLAMKLFEIPDIRLFWSKDSGFLSQFETDNPYESITYKPVSVYPQCNNDISFWIPEEFSANDFYEIVREVGGDIVEQVKFVDDFFHPKKQRRSQCYRITYRDMHKTLTQEEVNVIHREIENRIVSDLHVEMR